MYSERLEISALEWINEFFNKVSAGARVFDGKLHAFTTESKSKAAKDLKKLTDIFYLEESTQNSVYSPKIDPKSLEKIAPESIEEIHLTRSLSNPSISAVQMNYTRERNQKGQIPRLVASSRWTKTPFNTKDAHEREVLFYCIKAMK